jgi:hypothetical protein
MSQQHGSYQVYCDDPDRKRVVAQCLPMGLLGASFLAAWDNRTAISRWKQASRRVRGSELPRPGSAARRRSARATAARRSRRKRSADALPECQPALRADRVLEPPTGVRRLKHGSMPCARMRASATFHAAARHGRSDHRRATYHPATAKNTIPNNQCEDHSRLSRWWCGRAKCQST